MSSPAHCQSSSRSHTSNIGVIGCQPIRLHGLLPASVGAAAAAIPIRWDGRRDFSSALPTRPTLRHLPRWTEHLPNLTTAVVELTEIKLAWREVTFSAAASLLVPLASHEAAEGSQSDHGDDQADQEAPEEGR